MKQVPDHMPPWEKQLPRALRLACANNFILPTASFFTKSQVQEVYGKKALEEFSSYFKSIRQFDPSRAEKIRHKQAMGLYKNKPATWPEDAEGYYTPEKYADWLVKTKCFGWISIVHNERKAEVYLKYGDGGKL